MLIGQFKRSYEKQNGLTVFVYDVIGTSTELQDYKTSLGEYYREENDIPYFSTPYYVGKSCPFIKSLKKGNYLLDNEKLRIGIVELKQLGFSFYNYLYEHDKDENWLIMEKNVKILANEKKEKDISENRNNLMKNMEAKFLNKFKNQDLFIYEISGSENEILQYKKCLPSNDVFNEPWCSFFIKEGITKNEHRINPLFFTKHYYGKKRPFVFYKNHYRVEAKSLIKLDVDFIKQKQNLWKIIDHAVSDDSTDFSKFNEAKNLDDFEEGRYEDYLSKPELRFWSLNKLSSPEYNNSIHKTPIDLKNKLFEVLKEYEIKISFHAKFDEKELQKYYEDEAKAYKDAEMDRDANKMYKDETDSWGEDWHWNVD